MLEVIYLFNRLLGHFLISKIRSTSSFRIHKMWYTTKKICYFIFWTDKKKKFLVNFPRDYKNQMFWSQTTDIKCKPTLPQVVVLNQVVYP